MDFDPRRHPHRRYDPLRREWIVVSPHRTDRPWLGQVEPASQIEQPRYDPACYLCPGNPRAGGAINPPYAGTFAFDNDFPALTPEVPAGDTNVDGVLVARSERGRCRVLCFSPRHDLTLSTMPAETALQVVDAWIEQSEELGQTDWIQYVQIFENRGAMMGASNPHPHCQIWACESVPDEPLTEQASLLAWREAHADCLLCRCVALEAQAEERIVCENHDFVAIVPYWATWPFETLVLPRRHFGRLAALTERQSLADVLQQVTQRYDRLFGVPFPYSMGIHQAPSDGEPHDEWHLHVHFYPPLLRSATVRKFMVGFELLASPQRDLTPEDAAARLREA